MNVLITHEESQAVCMAFRKLGHDAFSCDLQKCSGGHPEWHIVNDAFDVIRKGKWDLIIMHPTCTYIAVSGNRWYGRGMPGHHKRIESLIEIESLWIHAKNHCDRVAMENPVGVIVSIKGLPKPQYIQPWMFGHGETKKTGLWLHNLPELKPTNVVSGREQRIWKMGPSPERQKLRSKTYPGIAKAMAEQWGIF